MMMKFGTRFNWTFDSCTAVDDALRQSLYSYGRCVRK